MAFNVRKPQATKFTTASAPATKQPERVDPSYRLKVGQAVEKGEKADPPESICLMWEKTDKKGKAFYRGSHKESNTFFIFQPGRTGDNYTLTTMTFPEGAPKGSKPKFEQLCVMEKKEAKNGVSYYVGNDSVGQRWFVYPYEKKE